MCSFFVKVQHTSLPLFPPCCTRRLLESHLHRGISSSSSRKALRFDVSDWPKEPCNNKVSSQTPIPSTMDPWTSLEADQGCQPPQPHFNHNWSCPQGDLEDQCQSNAPSSLEIDAKVQNSSSCCHLPCCCHRHRHRRRQKTGNLKLWLYQSITLEGKRPCCKSSSLIQLQDVRWGLLPQWVRYPSPSSLFMCVVSTR